MSSVQYTPGKGTLVVRPDAAFLISARLPPSLASQVWAALGRDQEDRVEPAIALLAEAFGPHALPDFALLVIAASTGRAAVRGRLGVLVSSASAGTTNLSASDAEPWTGHRLAALGEISVGLGTDETWPVVDGVVPADGFRWHVAEAPLLGGGDTAGGPDVDVDAGHTTRQWQPPAGSALPAAAALVAPVAASRPAPPPLAQPRPGGLIDGIPGFGPGAIPGPEPVRPAPRDMAATLSTAMSGPVTPPAPAPAAPPPAAAPPAPAPPPPPPPQAAPRPAPVPPDGSGLTSMLTAADAAGGPSPQVLAVQCPQGHLSPAHAAVCRVCGIALPPQQPHWTARPRLGRLLLPRGEMLDVDRGIIFGRAPVEPEGLRERPHLINLSRYGPHLSRMHLEIVIEDWLVMARDLGSTSGTLLTIPGHPAERLRAHEAVTLQQNSLLSLAGEYDLRFVIT